MHPTYTPTQSPPTPKAEESQPMTPREFFAAIGEHIEELRKRLLVAVIALAVTTLASFAFTEQILDLLTLPIGGLENLQSIEITENVSVFMRVSLLSGFILALPVIVYELLAFIMPGLEPKERRWVNLFIPFATLLFLAGVAFSYFVMLPVAVPFLVTFLGIQTEVRPASYINFVTNLMFWIGVVFEMPLIVFMLAKFRIVSAAQLLKQWRIAIVLSAGAAALITPTVDPVNMGLLMAPLIVLYFLSVLFARLAGN